MTAPAGFLPDAPAGFVPDEAPQATPAPSETAFGKVARIAGEEAVKTPGRVVEGIKNLVSGGAEALQNPKLSTLLPLAVTGGSSAIAIPGIRAALDNPATTSVVTRLGSIAAGRMMDQPSTDWWENLKTGAKGVIGDWQKPMSMLTSPAAMEAVAPGIGKAFQATGAGQRATNAADATRLGQTMEDIAPPLAGARTAGEIRSMAAGPGKASLGSAKGDVVNTIQARVGDITVPSLGPQPMSLQAANDELSAIGARAFSKNPLDRTFNGIDQRRLWGQVSTDIEKSLAASSPAAAQAWRDAQSGYSAGLATLRLTEKPGAYRNTTEGVELNMPYLQKLVAQPKNEALLRNKLGDSNYDQLVKTLTGGAPIGSADRMSSRPLGLLEDKGSLGTWAPAVRFAKKFFPNASSSYAGAGRVPYAAPSGIHQTVADVLAEMSQ